MYPNKIILRKMKSGLSRLGAIFDSFLGGRLSESKIAVDLYRRLESGWYSFDEFNIYVPPARVGIWEDEAKDFIKERSNGKNFWDIGSNIGFHSLYVAKIANHVRAFEPEPTNNEILNQNVGMNNFQNVKVHQIAISSTNGSTQLFRNATKGSGTHSLANDGRFDAEPCTVETKTVDELSRQYTSPDFMKIDVEGAELKVLQGAQSVLENHNLECLIEVHSSRTGVRDDRLKQQGGDVESVYELLSEHGYNVYGYDNGVNEFDINDDRLPVQWFASKNTIG
jgi:FkbM family methyltransferase